MNAMQWLWTALPAFGTATSVAFLSEWRRRKQVRSLTGRFQERMTRDAEKQSGLKAQVEALQEELKKQRAVVAKLTALNKTSLRASPPAADLALPSPMNGPFAARETKVRESLGFEDTQILG